MVGTGGNWIVGPGVEMPGIVGIAGIAGFGIGGGSLNGLKGPPTVL
jgi:hypothetical protein